MGTNKRLKKSSRKSGSSTGDRRSSIGTRKSNADRAVEAHNKMWPFPYGHRLDPPDGTVPEATPVDTNMADDGDDDEEEEDDEAETNNPREGSPVRTPKCYVNKTFTERDFAMCKMEKCEYKDCANRAADEYLGEDDCEFLGATFYKCKFEGCTFMYCGHWDIMDTGFNLVTKNSFWEQMGTAKKEEGGGGRNR